MKTKDHRELFVLQRNHLPNNQNSAHQPPNLEIPRTWLGAVETRRRLRGRSLWTKNTVPFHGEGSVPIFPDFFSLRKDALVWVLGGQKAVISPGLRPPCATQTERWEVDSEGQQGEGPWCAWPLRHCSRLTCIGRVPTWCSRALEHNTSAAHWELVWCSYFWQPK